MGILHKVMKLQNKNKNDGAGSKSCGFKSALFIYYLKDVCVMRLKTHELKRLQSHMMIQNSLV